MEPLTYFWIFLSYFGDIAYWLGFAISFLLIYPFLEEKDKRKQIWILYYLLPAVLLSYLSSFFLKLMFKVPRICAGLSYCPETYAFPSGHATIAFAFFTIVFLKFKEKPHFYLPILLLALLVCYSRLALQVHTLIDILGGSVIGITLSLIWYYFFRRIKSRKNSLHFYFRKLIHLGGIIVIILRLGIGEKYVFGFTAFLTVMFFVSEILRLRKIYFPIFHDISIFCKKREERGFLVEPFLFGFSLCVLLLFPSNFFLAGSLPLIIGDALAGLIGYRFGLHKLFYNKTKSIEGSLAFFISTFGSSLFFFDLKTSLFLSIFSTLLESILRKYENLLLPLGCTAFYTFLRY